MKTGPKKNDDRILDHEPLTIGENNIIHESDPGADEQKKLTKVCHYF